MEIRKYMRKPFIVEAVQVTLENMEEVAKWCRGEIRGKDVGPGFVKVKVYKPVEARQTQAHVGDWVLRVGKGWKVYNEHAFRKSFDPADTEMSDGLGGVVRLEVDPVNN